MKLRTLMGGLGFAALLLSAGVTTTLPAAAQRYESCYDRIRHAERHLGRMVHRFGRHSREARQARRDLENVRDYCRRHDHRRNDRDHRPHH